MTRVPSLRDLLWIVRFPGTDVPAFPVLPLRGESMGRRFPVSISKPEFFVSPASAHSFAGIKNTNEGAPSIILSVVDNWFHPHRLFPTF